MKFASKLFLPMVVAATATANAAITLTASQNVVANVDYPRTSTDLNHTTSNWSLNGGNAVAVLFASEGANNFSATFGGQSLTVVQQFDGDRFTAGIAYLINPAVSVGDLVVNNSFVTGRNSTVHSIVSLSGVGSVAGSDTATANGGLSYTTSADGGFVLGAALNNSFNFSTQVSVTGNPDTNLFHSSVDGNQSSRLIYGDVVTAGSYTDNYNGNLEASATVAFDPIPEPTAALLGGIGSLLLLRRRRNS